MGDDRRWWTVGGGWAPCARAGTARSNRGDPHEQGPRARATASAAVAWTQPIGCRECRGLRTGAQAKRRGSGLGGVPGGHRTSTYWPVDQGGWSELARPASLTDRQKLSAGQRPNTARRGAGEPGRGASGGSVGRAHPRGDARPGEGTRVPWRGVTPSGQSPGRAGRGRPDCVPGRPLHHVRPVWWGHAPRARPLPLPQLRVARQLLRRALLTARPG